MRQAKVQVMVAANTRMEPLGERASMVRRSVFHLLALLPCHYAADASHRCTFWLMPPSFALAASTAAVIVVSPVPDAGAAPETLALRYGLRLRFAGAGEARRFLGSVHQGARLIDRFPGYSASASLSHATPPPPACTYAAPSLTMAVRSTMQVSIGFVAC